MVAVAFSVDDKIEAEVFSSQLRACPHASPARFLGHFLCKDGPAVAACSSLKPALLSGGCWIVRIYAAIAMLRLS